MESYEEYRNKILNLVLESDICTLFDRLNEAREKALETRSQRSSMTGTQSNRFSVRTDSLAPAVY